ncbi:MAG: hypothetical protein LBP59_16000 [Planctomycetaceae bacterium]|nr:hypothetical protein [Planctomycetaceae bacterium]
MVHLGVWIVLEATSIQIVLEFQRFILLVLEIQRLKSVKACRPIARQAMINVNSSANSLKIHLSAYAAFC